MNITDHIVTSANWDAGRGGHQVTGIVLHTMVGYMQPSENRFNDPNSQVSVNYGVGMDGAIRRWVNEADTAYQAGNYAVNQTTIGIEHEDFGNANDSVRTQAEYEASSDLVADICKRYGFPADSNHIFLHKNVIDKSHYPGGTACPDGLDTNKIISMAAAKLKGVEEMPNSGDAINFIRADRMDPGYNPNQDEINAAMQVSFKDWAYKLGFINDGDSVNFVRVQKGNSSYSPTDAEIQDAKKFGFKAWSYTFSGKVNNTGINHDSALKYVQDNLK